MKRVIGLLLLCVVCGLALAGPPQPKYYFTAKRPTASGNTQILADTNATIYGYPAVSDTAGKGQIAVYVGGALYQWVFIPDSTYTYKFVETEGPDTTIVGMDGVALFGPELIAADSAVVASTLRPDSDLRFRPALNFEFGPTDTLFFRYAKVDTVGNEMRLLGHMIVDTATVTTLIATNIEAETIVSNGDITGASGTVSGLVVTGTDEVSTVGKGVFEDSLRVGVAGVGSPVLKLYGTLNNQGGTVNTSVLNTTGKLTVGDAATDSLACLGPLRVRNGATLGTTGSLYANGDAQLGDAGTDSAKVYGDLRVRGGDIVAGTAGQAGTVSISDGSSNTTTFGGSAWGSNVTINTPFFFVDCKLRDVIYVAAGEYRWSYYVAGLDSSYVAINTKSALYDPGGVGQEEEFPTGGAVASVTRPFFSYCKTDSLVLTSHTCCTGDEFTHVFVLVAKKNTWITRP